jgi:hypothetical protein
MAAGEASKVLGRENAWLGVVAMLGLPLLHIITLGLHDYGSNFSSLFSTTKIFTALLSYMSYFVTHVGFMLFLGKVSSGRNFGITIMYGLEILAIILCEASFLSIGAMYSIGGTLLWMSNLACSVASVISGHVIIERAESKVESLLVAILLPIMIGNSYLNHMDWIIRCIEGGRCHHIS